MTTPTYIIAEAGVNHNGSFDLAIQLLEKGKEIGADAVKFQTFKAESLTGPTAKKAEYQVENTGNSNESQLEMIQKLELSFEEHYKLFEYAKKIGVQYLSSPFDLESLDFLIKMNIPYLKIPSGEITNAPLILKAAQSKIPLIMSTGMATIEEIAEALGVIQYGRENSNDPKAKTELEYNPNQKIQDLTILHCTTDYPCPFGDVNLLAMECLRETFHLPIGYSDHTEGILVPTLAVGMGATMIEKHFTLDKEMEGPDHKASLNPMEFHSMVEQIRVSEKVLGKKEKIPGEKESKNRDIVRKSIVAKQDIQKGESFSHQNLTCKRPATGLSPFEFWDKLKEKANENYKKDDFIR